MAAAIDISDLPAPPDISDLPAPPSATKEADIYDPEGDAARAEVGGAQLVGSTLANIPHAAAHAVVDLYHRLTGNADAKNQADTLPAWAGGPVPLGEEGQQLAGGLSTMASPVTAPIKKGLQAADTAIGNFSPTLQDVLHQTGGVVSDVANLAPAAGLVKSGVSGLIDAAATRAPTISEAAQEAANRVATSGNAGAAGTAVDATKLSPETQAELATVKNVNPTALKNIHDAETLPVPMTGERGLTAGQATQDSDLISHEFNRKGENGNVIGKRYDAQDAGLQENLEAIHRDAAPTTVGNDDIQNGQAVIDSLKRYDQPKVEEINAAYKAAKDANGGDLQMDGSGFTDAAEAALKAQGRSRFLPSSVRGIIDDVKESGGKMSLDDFEGYRTALSNEARKAQISGDGNAVAAINKVRDALEATPPADGTSAAAKTLYDNARGLAKNRFAEMEADPAYAAAVADPTPIGRLSPDADKFTSQYVLNGAKADLQKLRPKLDQEGGEAMTSAAMNYLKKQAGLDKGKFIQNGYNTALTKIGPKAAELVGNSDAIDQLQKLGRVSKNMQVSSRGGYPNTSHSFVAAAKALGTHAVEDLANGVVPGVRLGTKAAEFLARRQGAASLHELLKPGAGLEL